MRDTRLYTSKASEILCTYACPALCRICRPIVAKAVCESLSPLPSFAAALSSTTTDDTRGGSPQNVGGDNGGVAAGRSERCGSQARDFGRCLAALSIIGGHCDLLRAGGKARVVSEHEGELIENCTILNGFSASSQVLTVACGDMRTFPCDVSRLSPVTAGDIPFSPAALGAAFEAMAKGAGGTGGMSSGEGMGGASDLKVALLRRFLPFVSGFELADCVESESHPSSLAAPPWRPELLLPFCMLQSAVLRSLRSLIHAQEWLLIVKECPGMLPALGRLALQPLQSVAFEGLQVDSPMFSCAYSVVFRF